MTTDKARKRAVRAHERLADAADVAAHRSARKARLERLGDVWTTGCSKTKSSDVLTEFPRPPGATRR